MTLRVANSDNRVITGLLGDTTDRDYSHKLRLFAAFAEPELRAAIKNLQLKPGMRVLDAGCGTGEALKWLADEVLPGRATEAAGGTRVASQALATGHELATGHAPAAGHAPMADHAAAVGLDLSNAHVAAARAHVDSNTLVLQADLLRAPLPPHGFDLVWCVNTINHLRNPIDGIVALTNLVRPRGRVVLGQSSFLPDMYFAWDARLERVANEAVRQYYRDRYGLNERDLTSVRSLVGWARSAQLRDVSATTFLIERLSPLRPADSAYLLNAIFRDTWGQRLQKYLSPADYGELQALCDPAHARFALTRPDFHFLQSFTLVTGTS